MSSNSFLARRQRLVSVFEDTMDYIEHSQECLDAISYSIQNQKFIPQEKTIDLPLPKYDTPAQIRISQLRSFEAAAQYQGQHVAVLNFASATTPGGGVEKGASAQEEALCRCSTLLPCIQACEESFYIPHRASVFHRNRESCRKAHIQVQPTAYQTGQQHLQAGISKNQLSDSASKNRRDKGRQCCL